MLSFVTLIGRRNRAAATATVLAGLCLPAAATPPRYDHVVVVFEENEGLTRVIGNRDLAPYINSLADGGVTFNHMRAVTHPSQPNYLEFFSGDNQGVVDDVPFDPPNRPTTANLGASLIAAGFTFIGYADALPTAGDTFSDGSNGYARRHCPWIPWVKSPPLGVNQLPRTIHQPFTAFPTDFTQLPTVALVTPSNLHNMHDLGVNSGDVWLRQNLDQYAQWARTHNSLLIVTWDEDDFQPENLIPTIFYGANLRQGVNGGTWTLHNLLRTLEDMYGLPHSGRAAMIPPITGTFAGETPIGTYRTTLGEHHAVISRFNPSSASGSGPVVSVSASSSAPAQQALLGFDNFFGSGTALPGNYPVVSAKLLLVTTEASAGQMMLHRMLQPWSLSSTWNSLGNGVSPDGLEAAASPDFSAVPSSNSTNAVFDATSSIAAWMGGAANDGWLLQTTSSDSWSFSGLTSRPALEISGPASSVTLGSEGINVAEDVGSVTVDVHRTGDISQPITVAYSTVDGTARAGSDYTAQSGTLTWAAGENTTRQITVPILTDDLYEADEYFSVKLLDTAGPVLLDNPSSYLVTIKVPPYQNWRVNWFGAAAPDSQAGELADPDGDTRPNLLEYALGTYPIYRDLLPLVSQTADGYARISFNRPSSNTDLIYTVQASGDLITWEDGSTYGAGASVPSNSVTTEVSHSVDYIQRIVVRDNVPITEGAPRFLRLKVSRTAPAAFASSGNAMMPTSVTTTPAPAAQAAGKAYHPAAPRRPRTKDPYFARSRRAVAPASEDR